jgi:hypothetical protein
VCAPQAEQDGKGHAKECEAKAGEAKKGSKWLSNIF